MTLRWLTFDMRSGEKIRYLPTTTTGGWDRAINDPGSLQCTIPATAVTKALNLRESTRPARTGLACIEGDRVLQAGPIWTRRATETRLTLSAGGMWSFLDHRYVIRSILDGQTVAGEIDPESADWVLAFTSESYSNIAKGLIAEMMAWTGGDLPIVLPADVAGDHVKTYPTANFGTVGQRLRDLANLQFGPEIRFDPQFTAQRSGLQFLLRVGDPELTPAQPLRWNGASKKSQIKDIEVYDDGRMIAGLGWGMGGRQLDKTVVVKVEDPWLVEHGYPLLEALNRDHTTASEVATLQSYVSEQLLRARRSTETLQLRIRRNHPEVGSYLEGAHVNLKLAGHWYLPDGTYEMKVTSLSGDHSDWVKVGLDARGA